MFLVGCAGFALFFLGDYNDLRLRKRALALCFPAGCALLTVSAAALALRHPSPLPWAAARAAAWALTAVFLALEVYTLFFAIPAGASYAAPGKKRPVCRAGVYALCRHPGVLWFGAAFFFLWLAAGLPLGAALVWTALDVLLVIYEDAAVFPALMDGYDDYRASTPFLIPTCASLRRCFSTDRIAGKEKPER